MDRKYWSFVIPAADPNFAEAVRSLEDRGIAGVAIPQVYGTPFAPLSAVAVVMTKLELVHMADAEKKYPAELSGGMKKRAGLARAIIREPEIILYDEPTAGLDPIIAGTINELILEMQERLKVTSILVTHDMSSCFKVADRMAMLLEGRIYRLGTPDELKGLGDPILDQFIFGESEGPLTRTPKKE